MGPVVLLHVSYCLDDFFFLRRTAIASAIVFANGVDHWRAAGEDDHRFWVRCFQTRILRVNGRNS